MTNLCYNKDRSEGLLTDSAIPSNHRYKLKGKKGTVTMKITITGRQMNVWDSLKEQITSKLVKLECFFGDETEVLVTCRSRRELKIIEITVYQNGTIFRSEKGDATFQNALDSAMDTLERQIRKNKTRLAKRIRTPLLPGEGGSDDPSEPEEGEFQIRTKTFPFKPMSVDEAILQMNLLEHQFFVFINAETETTCVVYKRLDGNYGLIVPEQP